VVATSVSSAARSGANASTVPEIRIIESATRPAVQAMRRAEDLNTYDISKSTIIPAPGMANPASACSRPSKVEPSSETVGTSEVRVNRTIPTSMMAMIESGRARFE